MSDDQSTYSNNTPDETATETPPGTKKAWPRVLYMIGFGFAGHFVLMAIFFIAFVQAIIVWTTGERQAELSIFARNLAAYLAEIVVFVAWVSDIKPFPARPFPSTEDSSV